MKRHFFFLLFILLSFTPPAKAQETGPNESSNPVPKFCDASLSLPFYFMLNGDLQDIFGPNYSPSATDSSQTLSWQIEVDFYLAPDFQLGPFFQQSYRAATGLDATLNCWGIRAKKKLFPNDWFGVDPFVALGSYSVNGSLGLQSYLANAINGDSPGVEAGLGFVLNSNNSPDLPFSLELDVGGRYVLLDPLYASIPGFGANQKVMNNDGSQASLDFSGLFINLQVIRATFPAEPKKTGNLTPGLQDKGFLKAGGGLVFEMQNSGVDESAALPAGSLAMGVDCPDHFSFFADASVYPKNEALTGNAQYTLELSDFVNPYLYAGLGFDFFNTATGGVNEKLGLAMGWGVGLEFGLEKGARAYTELKGMLGSNMGDDYVWVNGFFPVGMAGVKFSL